MKRFNTTLFLSIAMLTSAMAQSPDFNGTWKGTIGGGPFQLTIVFHIEQKGDSVSFTWDSPDQKIFDLPGTATINGNELNIKMNVMKDDISNGLSEEERAEYAAEMSSYLPTFHGLLKGDTIDGLYSQMGAALPLQMTKATGNDRPQEAALEADQNKPYHSEEVTFNNGDITLAGTLTVPNSGTRFPAVVFVHGTGLLDRDETMFRHKPFLLLADALSRRGFAVLRYDKRGTGESQTEGITSWATALMADDAMAAVRYLASRPEVDASQVGILGHSEGGMIAFMNAANYPDEIAYIVSMAGVAVSGSELSKKQRRMIMSTMGMDLDEEKHRFNDQVVDIIATENDSIIMRQRIKELLEKNKTELQEATKLLMTTDSTSSIDMLDVIVEMTISRSVSPDIRGLVRYDPNDYLPRVKCPTLAINGTFDCQVESESNLAAVARLIPHATVKAYEGKNHMFQSCKEWVGSSNYANIQETLAPEVIEDIASWLETNVKR